jgi:hypothetical protein
MQLVILQPAFLPLGCLVRYHWHMPLIKIVVGKEKSSTNQAEASMLRTPEKTKPRRKKRIVISIVITIILASGLVGAATWLLHKQPANTNPFTPALTASIKYPLYHPTVVPPSFHVEPKSVQEPVTGVVTFYLSGPKGQKIYFSEEARPARYDIGGFFKKFGHLNEYYANNATIATGTINNGQTKVGSMLNNQVWILVNTASQSVSLSQIDSMLRSLTSAVTP